jgi:hypothetical protein
MWNQTSIIQNVIVTTNHLIFPDVHGRSQGLEQAMLTSACELRTGSQDTTASTLLGLLNKVEFIIHYKLYLV